MSASPIVLTQPYIQFQEDIPTPGAAIDVSCYVFRVEISPSTDTVDLATWCNPGAQAEGKTTWEATIDWKVSLDATESLYEDVEPLVGKDVLVSMQAQSATHALQFRIGLPFNPALSGGWEVGTVVETSTSHGLRAEPERITAVTPAVGMASASSSKASKSAA